MRGGNSSLKARFTVLGRTIIIGSWAKQGLADLVARYITIAAKNTHVASQLAESAVIVIGTWRYGISYSHSLTAKKMEACRYCPTRILILAWGLSVLRQSFRESIRITRLICSRP